VIHLEHRYVDDVPELTVPATAAPAPEPRLLVLNEALAGDLDLDVAFLRSPAGLQFLLGLEPVEGSKPVAMRYAGHQFGGYSPALGDGRAMLLGEIRTESGFKDLHLKGSGPTELSRGGDGLAAVGPMLREYLVSEAMHALGIPTTRSLAVLATGAQVVREDGTHPGAVLVRVASSHIRVGTFQLARASNQMRVLVKLSRHAIERHLPTAIESENPPIELFEHVVKSQAALVAQWITVGFVHGVMNTDNVTVSGETIDYGPCAFLDSYSPAAVFSSIDTGGRYAFGSQPGVAQWNLARFAEALLPIVTDSEEDAVAALTPLLENYPVHFNQAWLGQMAAKLGVEIGRAGVDEENLTALVTELHGYLEASAVDFTSFFRQLALAARGDREQVRGTTLELARLDAWLEQWLAFAPDADAMDAKNPLHIPRNHLVEEALAAATDGDLAPFEALLAAVQAPFTPVKGGERFAQPAPASFKESFRTFCGT
jgi:serine/tyrosine/threonine adenylyltransferase